MNGNSVGFLKGYTNSSPLIMSLEVGNVKFSPLVVEINIFDEIFVECVIVLMSVRLNMIAVPDGMS